MGIMALYTYKAVHFAEMPATREFVLRVASPESNYCYADYIAGNLQPLYPQNFNYSLLLLLTQLS